MLKLLTKIRKLMGIVKKLSNESSDLSKETTSLVNTTNRWRSISVKKTTRWVKSRECEHWKVR